MKHSISRGKHGGGYHVVRVGGVDIGVHRLVAILFVPNPADLPQVNHKDGDKDNNHDWNLEWSTMSDNIRHAFDNGLMFSRRVQQLDTDGNVIATFDNARRAGESTGISYGHIYEVCYNRSNRKSAGGYKWRYEL